MKTIPRFSPVPIRAATALLLAAVVAMPHANAEDIDIFTGVTSTNDLPNVLIVWDSSANWSASISVGNCSFNDGTGGPKASNPGKEQGAKMAIEKCAIYNVIDALPTTNTGDALFNVGLMLFNESPAANSGGYPRKQFLPMTAANKAALKSAIAAITIGGDKGNNAAFSKTLYEAYLMFSKATPYRGTAGSKWDPAAVVGGKYVGPPGTGCGKNHIIFVANGGPGEVTDNEAKALLAAAGGNTTALAYPASYIKNSDQSNWADEYTRFLRGVDVTGMDGVQNITTHAIAVTGASSDGTYPNFIRAMAQQGGGQYYSASDATALTQFLTNIFNAIQAANSVFASASLPVSVNAQGTYKNQVFVGVFRPDANAVPRWFGNLKQYKFSYDPATNTLQLADVLGFPALNSSTGFFMPTAVSAWTTSSNFWVNDPRGDPPSASDLPDGPVVEKGGAAQRLRAQYATEQASRKVLTCIACASGATLGATAQTQFVDANSAITNAMLSAADSAERATLINWIRGADNRADELGPGGTTTVRPSVHGDVLHSRPAAVDYGGATGTVLFYGGNDGFLHAIDGNLTGASAGNELWTFVPQEFFGRFKRLRDNLPEIRFPSTPPSANAMPRDYMVDGPITIYQKLTASGAIEKVLMYVSMRRGGRFLYAFDVTNPLSPKFLWKRNSDDFNLGQTWSEPRIVQVKGNLDPVLVLGGGYDAPAEDATPPAAASTMGKAVFVLDAVSGTLLKTLATSRSVPASITMLDTDYDGYVDRGYAVDAGGNVYRIDFETASGDGAPANWNVAPFANLGNASTPRKFFYDADVVQTAQFVAVMVGSGNRENPLLATTGDRWYTLFDYSIGKGPAGVAAIQDAQVVPYANYDAAAHPPGCYIAMDPAGEKVVTGTVSTGGNSYFATNMPTPVSATSCVSNLGLAKTYQVPLFCGTPNTQQLAGGGLPPTPVTGYVEVTYTNPNNPEETGSRTVPFIIGGPNPVSSGIGASRVPINVDPTRRRTYWYTNTNR
jgi:type IV pilus assembly protein PilY1